MESEFFTPHAKILIVLFRSPGLTVKETFNYSNISIFQFNKAKKDLLADGLVKEVTEGNRKRLYLTEKGEKIVNGLLCLAKAIDSVK